MVNDLNQYYRYHRCKGHSTDDCKILKRDIENLIQKGFLKNFVACHDRSKSPHRDKNAPPRRGQEQTRANKGTLNVISGGFAVGGETSGAREVYALQISGNALTGKRPTEQREVIISFSKCEMKHVTCPQEDTFVIAAEIDDYDVKRVLIDSGSSTDVFFLDALKKMGRSKKDMKKVNFPLMGFASQATYPVGAITSPVFTLNVMFIVVGAHASYNAILGRYTLNTHRMVHFLYHQMMKFSTLHAIRVVKGGHPMARTCYVHSMYRHVLKKKKSLMIQTEKGPKEDRSRPQPVND